MTNRDAYVFGWIYGHIAKNLPESKKPTAGSINQAMTSPMLGFGDIINTGMKHISGFFEDSEVAAAASELPSDIPANIQTNAEEQSNWSLGYHHGIAGVEIQPATFDIAEKRRRKKMTQEDLARAMGVDRAVISRWEHGVNKPNNSNLEKLKKILC